jgi:Rrf2 family protein
MLSQKTRYAMRALLVLAQQPKGESITIGDISRAASVPKKFLEQILLDLKHRGILRSIRGKHGGYALGRPADSIFFAEVIRAIDGPLALSPCVSVTAYQKCGDCIDEKTCAMRKVLLDVRNATADILESRSLASMASASQRGAARAHRAK